MKPAPILLLTMAMALAVCGCRDERKPSTRRQSDSNAAEIARLKVEMERRVREARDEHALRAARLRTIRIAAFVLLTGGAVTWIILIHRMARNTAPLSGIAGSTVVPIRPQWSDYIPPASGRSRVIEIPPMASTAATGQAHPPARPHHRQRRGRHHNQHQRP